MAACRLCPDYEVRLYEKEKNLGQKMLVAGKGGFNITNSLPAAEAARKYSPPGFMEASLENFDSLATRKWLSELGIPTFVGSSGRVFPEKDIKALDVLRRITGYLVENGAELFLQHEFIGFDNSMKAVVMHGNEKTAIEADYSIFSLGGASWPFTGSTGGWRSIFDSAGIGTRPFEPSNCGINIPWPEAVRNSHAGKPLKNIRLSVNGFESKGEAILTGTGLEGNAVYPLIPVLRNALKESPSVSLIMDFKPFNSPGQLLGKIPHKTVSPRDYPEVFNLNPAQLAVIKAFSDKETYLSAEKFTGLLKNLPVPVVSLRPVEEAISTVGGVLTGELGPDFSLIKFPVIFTIGEMVDWDAPTGGFLMQGCFAMGNHVAEAILKREGRII